MFPLISEQNTQTAKELPGKHAIFHRGWVYNNFMRVYDDIHLNYFWQLAAFMKSALYY